MFLFLNIDEAQYKNRSAISPKHVSEYFMQKPVRYSPLMNGANSLKSPQKGLDLCPSKPLKPLQDCQIGAG